MQICCALPRQVLFTLETDFIDSPVSSSTYFCAIFSSCFNCVFWLSASNNLFLDAFSCSVSAWPDTLNAWIWDSSSAVFSVMVTICWSRWSISVTRRSCSDLSVWQTINIYIKLRPYICCVKISWLPEFVPWSKLSPNHWWSCPVSTPCPFVTDEPILAPFMQ